VILVLALLALLILVVVVTVANRDGGGASEEGDRSVQSASLQPSRIRASSAQKSAGRTIGMAS
jgi:hypothetical protein